MVGPLECHGLVPWWFTLAATEPGPLFVRCHGLVPRWFTLAATEPGPLFCSMPRACPVVVHAGRYRAGASFLFDATGLSRGGSRWPLPSRGLFFCSMPRACPVVVHAGRYRAGASFFCSNIAANLTSHGSCQPNDPRDKPVDSLVLPCSAVAASRTSHGTSPWDSVFLRCSPELPT